MTEGEWVAAPADGWAGCPAPGAMVHIRFSDGIESSVVNRADDYGWNTGDIAAYRVVAPSDDHAAGYERPCANAPTPTPSEVGGLVERLRAVESSRRFGVTTAATTNWYRNPDGPEAASTIERLSAELARAKEALENLARNAEQCASSHADSDDWFALDVAVQDARAALAASQPEGS